MKTHTDVPLLTMSSSILRNRSFITALILFLILGFLFFPSAGRDDDYIVFWSADSLVEFGEIVNYNGDRLEQGSSLGHLTLLTIASSISRLPAPYIAVPISVISGILLLVLLGNFRPFFDRKVVNYALLLTATSFPFVYWSFSGIETSIYTLVLSIFCLVILKGSQGQNSQWKHLSLFFTILFLQLLRPEAFFVLGLLLGIFWLLKIAREIDRENRTRNKIREIVGSESTRYFLIAIFINFFAFAILASFRYSYFNSIFPQPVTSKLSGIFPGLQTGLPILPGGRYIFDFFAHNIALAGSIITGAIVVFFNIALRSARRITAHKRESTDILIAVTLAQFTFIFLAGPDWMEGFRFIVPIIPILSLMAAVFYSYLCEKYQGMEKPLIAILSGSQVIGFIFFIISSSSSAPLWATRNNIVQTIPGAQNYSWFVRANTRHLRDIPVAEALKDTIRELKPFVNNRPIVILSFQAGLVMYHVAKEHFGDIHFIDLAALADDTITKCSPLKEQTRKLRDEAAQEQRLGHLEVTRYLITESNKAGTCFSPRPDIIYMLGAERQFAPLFDELGYTLAFNNTGTISLDFGNKSFYGGYLVDSDLFTKAGIKFKQSYNSIEY